MACCFIGHRKIENKEIVYQKVKATVEMLIVEKNVRTFYFGSRSEFDDICHAVVTELQKTHPDIIRVNYRCKSEYVVKKDEREEMEKSMSEFLKTDIHLKDFEREKISDRVYSAGKASYIERNQEMIDDSNYCVFFYREDYQLQFDRNNKKSGTKLAYEYALRKRKVVINIVEGKKLDKKETLSFVLTESWSVY